MKEQYPTEKELQELKNWPRDDFFGLINFIKDIWNHDYGSIVDFKDKNIVTAFTGGWSGNEYIIEAINEEWMSLHFYNTFDGCEFNFIYNVWRSMVW